MAGASASEARSCLASALRVSSVAIWAMARSRRSLQACRSVPMALRRRSASSASRASACASARTSASSARLPSISVRMAASWPSSSADGGSSASALSATPRPALRLVAAGAEPGLGLGQGGDARGVARHLALGHGMQLAGVVGLALRRCANARGRRLRPRRPRSASACAASAALRFSSTAVRAVTSSPSMSERRLRCARRRAAPVGAWASAAKPSQRQRSPSRETRRWPGLSRPARRAPSARSTTPIWARRRDSSGGACTILGERLRAFRQRRIGRVDRGAHPAHGVLLVDRRVEIVAERRAERDLVALLDGHLVDHRRPHALGLDRQQLHQGLGFGVEALHRAFGVGQRNAGGIEVLARRAVGGFGGERRLFALSDRGLRAFERGGERRDIGPAFGRRRQGRLRYWRFRLPSGRRARTARARSGSAGCAWR